MRLSLLPSPSSFVPAVGSASTFAIHHYCGKVVYDIYNLLNANADTVADDIIAAFNSKARLVTMSAVRPNSLLRLTLICCGICGVPSSSCCRTTKSDLSLTMLIFLYLPGL